MVLSKLLFVDLIFAGHVNVFAVIVFLADFFRIGSTDNEHGLQYMCAKGAK